MDLPTFVLLAILLFLVAFIYSNLGLGGGLLYVPILLSLVSPEKEVVVPISLAFAAGTGLSAFYNHWRLGYADVRLGSILMSGTLIGSFIGVLFTKTSTREQFIILFISVLCIFGVKMLYDWSKRPTMAETDDDAKMTKGRMAGSTTVEVGSGFLSGALGVGGGLVNVPVLIYGLGRATRKAIGTSSLVVVPTSVFGFFIYLFTAPSTPSEFWLIPALLPLVLIGAFIGSRWGLQKLKTRTVALIFILMLFVAATKMVWDLIPK